MLYSVLPPKPNDDLTSVDDNAAPAGERKLTPKQALRPTVPFLPSFLFRSKGFLRTNVQRRYYPFLQRALPTWHLICLEFETTNSANSRRCKPANTEGPRHSSALIWRAIRE